MGKKGKKGGGGGNKDGPPPDKSQQQQQQQQQQGQPQQQRQPQPQQQVQSQPQQQVQPQPQQVQPQPQQQQQQQRQPPPFTSQMKKEDPYPSLGPGGDVSSLGGGSSRGSQDQGRQWSHIGAMGPSPPGSVYSDDGQSSRGGGRGRGQSDRGRGQGDRGRGQRDRGRGWGRGGPGGPDRQEYQPPSQTSQYSQPPPQGAMGPSPPGSVYSDDGQSSRGGGRGRGQSDRGRGQGDRGRGQGDRGRGWGRGGPGGPDRQEYQPPSQTSQYSQPPPQGGPIIQQQFTPSQPPSTQVSSEPLQQQFSRPPPSMQQQPARPPDQGPALGQVTTGIAEMKVSSSGNGSKGHWRIPERKKIVDKNNMVGTRGRIIEIEVNHLLLNLKKMTPACHYDCAFKPDAPKKLFRPAIREMQRKHFPNRHPAFDGRKNLYSSGELPFGTQIRDTVSVSDPERNQPKEFDVTIKFANHVDMSLVSQYFSQRIDFPQEACQVLDIVLRNPAAMSFTPVGRSFFTPPRNQIISLGNGLELWYGFYQSSNLGWRPFLNVDVAHKGFPEPKPLLDVMLDMMKKHKSFRDPDPDYNMLRNAGISGLALEDFKKFIRGLKVDYMIPNQPNTRKVYKMNDIRASAIQHRFQLDDGRHITVGEYFERIKNYRLQFPKLPCIHVGSTSRDICLPPELCTVVRGQVVNKKLDETQTAAMVKAAARPADERKRRILQHMMEAGFNRDPCVNEFGISVNDKFEKIKARVLDAPNLEYRERKVKASQGVWRAAQFVSSNQLNTWVVMSLAQRTNHNDLVNFAKTMSSQGKNLGMSISEPCKYVLLHEEARLGRFPTGQVIKQNILPYFKEFKENGVQLVVVVIPDRPPDCYSRVKLAAEVDVGLLTQCIKERTFGRMNPATAGNILLKVNAKLNGVNHTIDRNFCPHLMDSPTMLVGADVTHPSPDQTTIPSVAAVAASHDRRAFQYNMIWKLQPPRMEIIEKLQEIMVDQLKFFYRFTKQKPNKIIFYRDGVSDGHFSQVLDSELSAIRAACRSLQADGSYKPSVTFLVVQKRHHTRFFPTRKEDEDGRNKNVPPGTIVDTVITHPREMDFYLVSHASLQGTSRPTKYHKLWDDSEISEDDLEELTYYLCHLFSRCTRSVSYPAPTYYAHLAAARGRVYLEGQQVNLTNLEQEMKIRTIKDSIKLQSPMFFV